MSPAYTDAQLQKLAWKLRQKQRKKVRQRMILTRTPGDGYWHDGHWSFSRQWHSYWHAFMRRALRPRNPDLVPVPEVHYRRYCWLGAGTPADHTGRFSIYPEQQLGFATLSRG